MNYVPNTEADRAAMLAELGIDSVDRLFEDIPEQVRRPRLNLPAGLSELEVVRLLDGLARRNADLDRYACFLGAGAYRHFVPSAIAPLLSRGEFLTSYTPYQPEISQGTLQAAYEFQSLVCLLTGMDVANASMYEGSSALAEAALLALRVTKRNTLAIAPSVHPEYRQVVRTYVAEQGVKIVEPQVTGGRIDRRWIDEAITSETAAVVVQHPNFFGSLEPVEELAEAAHRAGALFVVFFDAVSLGLLKPPGEYDADVAVSEGQPLGIPVSFGGPWVGLFTVKEKYLRQMPGRLVGQTIDLDGKRAFVLTLQAREQHIRREKATSNICTSQQLIALGATIYLSLLGPEGLRRVAEQCLQKAHYTAERIAALPGYSLAFDTPFFKEFVVRCPRPPAEINERLLDAEIVGGLELGRFYPDLADCMLLCVTEMNTREEIDRLVRVMSDE